MLFLIAAVSENYAIGVKNALPWRIKADLARFKALTLGHTVIMGARTYESLKKPLTERENIVLTRTPQKYENTRGASFCANAAPLFKKYAGGDKTAFIIGGGGVYEAALPYCEKLYITHIKTVVRNADAFFPRVNWSGFKTLYESDELTDAASGLTYRFAEYQRVEAP